MVLILSRVFCKKIHFIWDLMGSFFLGGRNIICIFIYLCFLRQLFGLKKKHPLELVCNCGPRLPYPGRNLWKSSCCRKIGRRRCCRGRCFKVGTIQHERNIIDTTQNLPEEWRSDVFDWKAFNSFWLMLDTSHRNKWTFRLRLSGEWFKRVADDFEDNKLTYAVPR